MPLPSSSTTFPRTIPSSSELEGGGPPPPSPPVGGCDPPLRGEYLGWSALTKDVSATMRSSPLPSRSSMARAVATSSSPVGGRPSCRWSSTSAASVLAPKCLASTSTASMTWPAALNQRCSCPTRSPTSPCFIDFDIRPPIAQLRLERYGFRRPLVPPDARWLKCYITQAGDIRFAGDRLYDRPMIVSHFRGRM